MIDNEMNNVIRINERQMSRLNMKSIIITQSNNDGDISKKYEMITELNLTI